jgi:hypothetical protein
MPAPPPTVAEQELRIAVRRRLQRSACREVELALVVRDPQIMPLGSPGQLDTAIRAISLDILLAINRERVRRLEQIDSIAPLFRPAAIAEATVAPLLGALASDEAELVALAYRLHQAGAVDLPQDEWWTPTFSRQLAMLAPHLSAARVAWVTNAMRQMLNVFPAWSSGSLPLREPVLHESRRFLLLLLGDVLVAEIGDHGA